MSFCAGGEWGGGLKGIFSGRGLSGVGGLRNKKGVWKVHGGN